MLTKTVNISSEECNLFVECYPSDPLPHLHPFHFKIQLRLQHQHHHTKQNVHQYCRERNTSVRDYIMRDNISKRQSTGRKHMSTNWGKGGGLASQSWWVLSQSACLVSFTHWRRGGRRVGGYEGLGFSHMGTLLHSHMFTEQGIKLKWIGESRGREIPLS